jgi:hypothetical protein
LIIHHIHWAPKRIQVSGKRKRIGVKNNTLVIPIQWNIKKAVNIRVKRN